MPTENGRSTGLAVRGIPLLVAVTGILMRALPLKVAALLMAWALFSLPLGIAIGHGALSED